MNNNDFAKVNVETGEIVKSSGQSITNENDFPSNGLMLSNQSMGQMTSSVQVESNRVLAEVMARIQLAQMMRRDQNNAVTAITRECARYEFAQKALYAYKRGTATVSGPSIRLAEAIARCWGNIDYGFREIGQGHGQSEIEAYAHDLETNTRISRTIVVKHVRDKRTGNEDLKSNRDIYEHTASQAQRRVRAVILELIPADITERAINRCKKTISDGDGKKTMDERIQDMLIAFEEFGITKVMIEDNLGHFVTAILPQELVKLQAMYTGIRDGNAKREDFFDLAAKPLRDVEKPVHKNNKKEEKKEPPKEEPEKEVVEQDEKEPETTVKLPQYLDPQSWPKTEKGLSGYIEKNREKITEFYDEMTIEVLRDYWMKLSNNPFPLDLTEETITESPDDTGDTGGEGDDGNDEVTSLMDIIPD